MAASKKEISNWFDDGTKANATHMIVVCDTYDHEDYPVFVTQNENAREVFDQFNRKNMQRVMEVYNLSQEKEKQLNEYRAYNF